jgi:hypothetical protein
MPMSRDRLRRDVVDGVPVFWTPDAPRRVGAICFRAGQSDETPTTTGVSHVVEHLALFGLGRRVYATNGTVDHIRTSFFAQGTGDEAAAFLADVTGQLASLPLDRLEAELRVLQTEAARRPIALFAQHLSLRYGMRGFGLTAVPELGLHTLTGETVSEWAAGRFTRGNAVACVSGPLPAGLRFALPDGPRHAPIRREPLPGVPARSWLSNPQAPGIAIGFEVERSTAGLTAVRVLTHRLEQRLRRDLGQSYEVSLAYVPIDGAAALASIFASCLPTDALKVRTELLQVVEAFAAEGPTRDELEWEVAAYARFAQEDDSIFLELQSAAHDELVGHPVSTTAQLLDEQRALQPAAVMEAFARTAARATLIDGGHHAPLAGGWSAHPISSASALEGRRLDPVSHRFWHRRLEQLVVGSDGVSWMNCIDGTILTVRYEHCAALVVEGPQLTLMAEDGTRILVHREFWKGGEHAARDIEASVPASRVVRVAMPGH